MYEYIVDYKIIKVKKNWIFNFRTSSKNTNNKYNFILSGKLFYFKYLIIKN